MTWATVHHDTQDTQGKESLREIPTDSNSIQQIKAYDIWLQTNTFKAQTMFSKQSDELL